MNDKPDASTTAMIAGRRADSTRRRQRVEQAITDATKGQEEASVSYVARRAGVDRSFLYRHPDLLDRIHTAQAQPPDTAGVGTVVSKASLRADLAAAQQRCTRMAGRLHQLETRLSELLGEQAWQESGLGAPTDIDQLQQRIAFLEHQAVDLQLQLDERDQELHAARVTNRELMTKINTA